MEEPQIRVESGGEAERSPNCRNLTLYENHWLLERFYNFLDRIRVEHTHKKCLLLIFFKERFIIQKLSRIHSKSLLRLASSLQPTSHLCAPTIEVIGSVQVTSWLRGMNHQLTSKSTFASKTEKAVRGCRQAKQAINLHELVL